MRIRELRTSKGVTQSHLAVIAGMDPATLNRLEQGKANPNLKTLVKLADALGVGVAELFEEPAAPKARRRSGRPKPRPEERRLEVEATGWAEALAIDLERLDAAIRDKDLPEAEANREYGHLLSRYYQALHAADLLAVIREEPMREYAEALNRVGDAMGRVNQRAKRFLDRAEVQGGGVSVVPERRKQGRLSQTEPEDAAHKESRNAG